MEIEEWRGVPGFEHRYQVSSLGRIRSYGADSHKRILKGITLPRGYKLLNARGNGKSTWFKVHRLVFETFVRKLEAGEVLDHIDRDQTNNAVKNLRACSRSENNYNSRPRKNKKSRYKGVCWNGKTSRWVVKIKANKKAHYVGVFRCEHEAACAYNKKALELHGEFAYLNEVGGRL